MSCSPYQIGLFAQLACVWEATARKPGNVHRFKDFEDCSYLDFVASAAALGPILAHAAEAPVGATVCEAVRCTRAVSATNTNLGMALLLAPLAKAARGDDLRAGLERVLAELDVNDAALVYDAIRQARPGGLGEAPEQDVRGQPTQTLREVMVLAADRDLVARQYANGFADVFDEGVPALTRGLERTGSLEGAIVYAHLHLMARHPDTLIARKGGRAEAEEAAARARRVLETGWPHGRAGWSALAELDAWLRAEGHRRNPGTTADLIAACLFVMLREGTIRLPLSVPWAAGFPEG
jgi:triphosphoribosyl-dephospho-CoA synthase